MCPVLSKVHQISTITTSSTNIHFLSLTWDTEFLKAVDVTGLKKGKDGFFVKFIYVEIASIVTEHTHCPLNLILTHPLLRIIFPQTMFSFSKKADPQIPAVSRLNCSGAQTKTTEITNPYVQLQNKHKALTSPNTGQKWYLFLLKNHFLNQHLYALSNHALFLQKFTSTFSFHKLFFSLVGSFSARTAVWNDDSASSDTDSS